MAQRTPIYDLMLLLSTAAPEERRAARLNEVESAIASGGGSIERNDDWGTRGLSYQIAHQTDADYHLLQFSGPPSLLESLSHTLRIADDVVRFRIIKVTPGTPPAPSTPPPIVAAVASSGPPPGAAQAAVAVAEPEVLDDTEIVEADVEVVPDEEIEASSSDEQPAADEQPATDEKSSAEDKSSEG